MSDDHPPDLPTRRAIEDDPSTVPPNGHHPTGGGDTPRLIDRVTAQARHGLPADHPDAAQLNAMARRVPVLGPAVTRVLHSALRHLEDQRDPRRAGDRPAVDAALHRAAAALAHRDDDTTLTDLTTAGRAHHTVPSGPRLTVEAVLDQVTAALADPPPRTVDQHYHELTHYFDGMLAELGGSAMVRAGTGDTRRDVLVADDHDECRGRRQQPAPADIRGSRRGPRP